MERTKLSMIGLLDWAVQMSNFCRGHGAPLYARVVKKSKILRHVSCYCNVVTWYA